MDAKWVIMVVCPVVCLALILVYVMIVNCCKDIQYVMWAIFACFIIICLFIGIYLMTDNAKRLFGYFPIIGGIIIVMTIGIVIYVLYDRERIKKSIELLNFASIYIRENPLLIFISLGSFIVWALIFAL